MVKPTAAESRTTTKESKEKQRIRYKESSQGVVDSSALLSSLLEIIVFIKEIFKYLKLIKIRIKFTYNSRNIGIYEK